MKKRKQLHAIETIRAIGALVVVFYHFLYVTNPVDKETFLVDDDFLHTWLNIGPQGLNMLFIVSGGVIYYTLLAGDYTIRDFPKFILRRAVRIFPPFWMALLGVCLIPLFYAAPYPYTPAEVAGNAGLLVDVFPDMSWINPVFITLKLEFLFYIGVGLCAWFLRKQYVYFLLVNGAGLVLSFWLKGDSFFIKFPFFLIGMNLSYYFLSPENKRYLIGLMLTTLYIAVVYSVYDTVSVLLCLGILLFTRNTPNWLRVLSERSYSLYLTHGISIIFVASTLFGKGLSIWAIIPVSCLTGWLFTVFFYRLIEKPATKWSKHIR